MNLDTEKLGGTKEAIITIVGFLGAGKTTVLRQLVEAYSEKNWSPFIILNDYENAHLDSQQFQKQLASKSIKSLTGSCICCTGLHQLRAFVNDIPERKNGVTLVEANGTTDACSLAGFLGTGLEDRFLPPVQLSVVDVKNWQRRGEHNDLEANQIQISSLIVLSHLEDISKDRLNEVSEDIRRINPGATILRLEELDVLSLPSLLPSSNAVTKLDHHKAHWASCSVDLPTLPNEESIRVLCGRIADSVLRVKGCVQLQGEKEFTYFERTPDGTVHIRPFYSIPPTGPKLLTVGLGSDPAELDWLVRDVINRYQEG